MTEPTGYTALDLVGFTDKGTYNAATAYVKNDLVHYLGNIWRCLIDDTTNITPVEGTNWTVFIEAPTNAIEGIIAPVETNPATDSYAVGRQFIYNDSLYKVITAITAGDTLVAYEDDPSNANIQLADPVETQLLDFEEKAYSTDDSAETALASDDLVPFYDTSAAIKKKMTVANMVGQTVSNPNLLDNPWFTVNQRGLSNFVNNGYGVDRWRFVSNGSTTISFTNNGIEISDYVEDNIVIAQRFESDLLDTSKDYTLSIMVSDGSILSSSLNKTNSLSFMGQLAGAHFFQKTALLSGIPEFELYVNGLTTDLTIRAIKLELGSVSTLAMDTAPNYTSELLKCQRYYHIYATESLRPSNMYDCVPVMASTPSQGTITIDSTTYYYNSADL